MDQLAALRGLLRRYWAAVQGDASDETMSRDVGLTRSTVYQIRTGRMNVTVEHIAKLADLQKKSIAVVLNEILALELHPHGLSRLRTEYGEVIGSGIGQLQRVRASRGVVGDAGAAAEEETAMPLPPVPPGRRR